MYYNYNICNSKGFFFYLLFIIGIIIFIIVKDFWFQDYNAIASLQNWRTIFIML